MPVITVSPSVRYMPLKAENVFSPPPFFIVTIPDISIIFAFVSVPAA